MRNSKGGFTLLEILIATAIFAFSIIILIQSRTVSLKNVIESENLFKATEVAQQKMVELELKYQGQIDREGVKDGTIAEDAGGFDPPNDQFKWKVKVTESSVKMSADELKEVLTSSFGMDKEDAEAQLEQQKLLLANLNKLLKENFAEMVLTITWKRFNREYSLPLVTHIIPNQPKIQLTTNADEAP